MAKQRKVSSALGDTVDFDLMRVKQNIESRDKPDSVEMREKYIDIRRRRNPRRNVSDLVTEQRSNESDARDRIQQSKKNKKESLVKDAESVVAEDVVSTTPEVLGDEMDMENKATSKKKIVKRSSQSEENLDN